MKKDNRWWRPLVAVLIVLAADIVVIMLAMVIDVLVVSETETVGHGFPSISTLAIWIMTFITAVVVVRSVVLTIMRLFKRDIKETGIMADESENKELKSVKPVYSYFIPWSIQVLVSALIVYLIGKYEIESFYNDPHHIGFAIPITAFMAAFFLLVLAVITFFISLYIYRRARRKHEKLMAKENEK